MPKYFGKFGMSKLSRGENADRYIFAAQNMAMVIVESS